MNQVYGRPTGEPPDELLERHAEAYDRARKALLRQGRRVFDQVVNVCAYGRFPGWFERQKLGFPRKGDHRRYEDLRSGLSELAKVFGL